MSDNFLAQCTPNNQSKTTLPSTEKSLVLANLSPHLVVEIKPCDKDGNALDGGGVVHAMLLDGDSSFESQWQTPFENSNPENKLPTLLAGLQSGQTVNTLGLLVLGKSDEGKKLLTEANSLIEQISNPIQAGIKKMVGGLESMIGRSSFTKVNSEQIFLASHSVRLSLSVGFLAYKNAKTEVENQVMLLAQWALPKSLADESIVQGLLDSKAGNALFPSEIPPFVSVKIHGKTYKPFIIENVGVPIKAPINENGDRLNLTVSLSLMSRRAWDANDINTLYGVALK